MLRSTFVLGLVAVSSLVLQLGDIPLEAYGCRSPHSLFWECELFQKFACRVVPCFADARANCANLRHLSDHRLRESARTGLKFAAQMCEYDELVPSRSLEVRLCFDTHCFWQGSCSAEFRAGLPGGEASPSPGSRWGLMARQAPNWQGSLFHNCPS